ncbi:hypothetical protein BT96DRAFT_939214 [Gymnopus androsaceus JB14]|uniref:Golgi apparatus membrane protein tvp38 n=1 Tax=Gymnopus androsaceus JB14 TaxID=1447944 RepID=A0A6A4HRL1_9AGAR|nr:hypothetical protein BT96DRAFT_939214 [Gymnopus androsaceus JB14]
MSYPLQVQPTIVPNSFSANASRSQAPPQCNHYPPRYDGNLDYPQPQAIKPAELTNGETWTANVNLSMARDPRTQIARTPSPTPSEAHELESIGSSSGLIDWKLVRSKDFWFSKKGLKYGLAAAVIITIAVLFHKLGWLIPVGLLIVLSFPPLFGHELVGLLCGVTWGIGIGFVIVALGTLLGEVANFFTFKHCCTTRARKYEKKKISYACLARVIRTGGFKVALAARYFPHSCSLFYQWNVEEGHDCINRKMDEVKPQVIYERRKARVSSSVKQQT